MLIYGLLVLILQIGFFNRFLFAGYINPYVYVWFLLLMPVQISRSLSLIIAFVFGLCLDIFENSGGLHAAVSTFLIFVRPLLLNIMLSRSDQEIEELELSRVPLLPMMLYALLGIFIHHFLLFLIESFNWRDFGTILERTLYSSLVSFLFILVIQLWNYRSKEPL